LDVNSRKHNEFIVREIKTAKSRNAENIILGKRKIGNRHEFFAMSLKCVQYVNGAKRNVIRSVYCLTRRFKSDDSPPDDRPKKNQEAIDKLNELLKTMKKGNDTEIVTKMTKLAKPRQMARKSEQEQKKIDESKRNQQLGKKLADAATSVARSIGGNTEKTESELLNLLRIYNSEPDDSAKKKPKSSVHLGELLSGMKIDRSRPSDVSSASNGDVDRAERIREMLGKNYSVNMSQKVKKYKKPMDNYVPVNILGYEEPLDVFKNFEESKNCPKLPTWDRLQEKSLQMAVTHPPKNIYEQMIIWTEQGKLWKFPIDNEQGMHEESKVFFAEHVFLEPLIDEWCPKKGPIRHFMELVCVGLSKNPFLSIEEKKKITSIGSDSTSMKKINYSTKLAHSK